MTNKYLKFLIAVSTMMCILFCSVNAVLAAPVNGIGNTSDGKRIIIGLPDTEEDSTDMPSDTVPVTSEKHTEISTEAPVTETVVETTKKTTVPDKKPTKTDGNKSTTKKKPVVENNRPAVNQTPAESQTTTLPEGSFFVYLELNNGQPRLKRVLNKAGLVPEPEEPVRNGYSFDGWYADAKLTEPWDFFTSVADKQTVIYAKWVADGSSTVYNIKIAETLGGILEVNPVTASEGETVVINVFPEEGKRIVSGSLTIDGESSDVFSFVMPAHDVVISAEFEEIPHSEIEGENSKSSLPFIIGGLILVIAVVVIIVAVLLRKRNFSVDVEVDENGTLVLDDDDDDAWVDESIVIEDGFANGKKVKENVEPDYGEDGENEES